MTRSWVLPLLCGASACGAIATTGVEHIGCGAPVAELEAGPVELEAGADAPELEAGPVELEAGADAPELEAGPVVRHFMFCGPTELTCANVCDASSCAELSEHTWCCRQ